MSVTVREQATKAWDVNHDGRVQFKELPVGMRESVAKLRVAFPCEFDGVDTLEGDALVFLEKLAPQTIAKARGQDAGRGEKIGGAIGIGVGAAGLTTTVAISIACALGAVLTTPLAVVLVIAIICFLVGSIAGPIALVAGYKKDDGAALDGYAGVLRGMQRKADDAEAKRKGDAADEAKRQIEEQRRLEAAEKVRLDALMQRRDRMTQLAPAQGELTIAGHRVRFNARVTIDWHGAEVFWDRADRNLVIRRLHKAGLSADVIDRINRNFDGRLLSTKGTFALDQIEQTTVRQVAAQVQLGELVTKPVAILLFIAGRDDLSDQQLTALSEVLALDAGAGSVAYDKAWLKADAVLKSVPKIR